MDLVLNWHYKDCQNMAGKSERIVALVQARMSSTRLPGKVLKLVEGIPLLMQMVNRVKRSQLIDEVVVITSKDRSDDVLYKYCIENGIHCFRGDLKNLLERHLNAAVKYKADICLKIPSDCPLIDPAIIDRVINEYKLNKIEYCSNLHPMTLPDGMDVEVFNINALRKAKRLACSPEEYEHTTTRMWSSNQFSKLNVEFYGYNSLISKYRFTVDYIEDFLFIEKVFSKLLPINPNFGLKEIICLLKEEPELCQINSQHLGDIWYLK